jgi:hypothetical protein
MFCLNYGEKFTALPIGVGEYRTMRFRRTPEERIDTNFL